MIRSLSCIGFRGFAERQTLKLAEPNGSAGSGLTVLVGPNGGGKSTIVECFNKITLADRGASFSKGKRNIAAGDSVEIALDYDSGHGSLKTIRGGSETSWEGPMPPKIYYLPSRRFFNPYFSNGRWDRNSFLSNPSNFQQRTNSLDTYTYRLIDLNDGDSSKFNMLLERILGYELKWAIDQEDNGQYIVKVTNSQGLHHNSDGLGEGVLSLMFIADALCGNEDELLIIDEPELSLHPQLQVRLMKEILEKTRNTQVVISTHSPNMVSLESIVNGGVIARVFESENGSNICMVDDESREFIKSVMNNLYNPHILGTDARACFFAEDGLIVTEGQEDVVLYPRIMEELGFSNTIPFFGFGAGGASDIVKIAHLLHELGFKKVGAIYDGDKKDEYDKFNSSFSEIGYKAWIIPADDIRDKEPSKTSAKIGLLKSDKKTLKPEYGDTLSVMFTDMKDYLSM